MIGIFDSGVGGLTVLRSVRERMPNADVIYFGDTGNAPYGVRSHTELSRLTVRAIERLHQGGAQNIISACNSVSATLALSLLDTYDVAPQQLVEMIGPTVAHFTDVDARIAVCATPATIESSLYQNAFDMVATKPTFIAIPELAGAIEAGASHGELTRIVREAVGNEAGKLDVVILACTHYPLVRDIFVDVLGPDVEVFDPADVVADRAAAMFSDTEKGSGNTTFLISSESAVFRSTVADMFPDSDYTIEVVN